ncbi:DUF551 domain-containing protein [Serratia sarumanii]|uniref:DUF551 domain-containing protein n=1 Tax=Serratia sarumanii TaxID=3020826 RepID=A0ABW8QK93_9GAMM
MTLTTETLNLWRNNAEITAGETAEDDPEHIAAKAILALTAQLLANREAQPVAWRHDDGPFAGIAITRAKSVADSWIAKGWTVTPLYTAPPAPAAVKLPTEFYSDEGIVVRLEEVMAALAVVGVQYERKANAKTRCECSLPSLPEEMTGGIAMSKYKVKKSNYTQWVKGWNACRAAMLAQHVSQGYKLQDCWVACSERMPEEGNVVLVCQEGGIIYCAEMQDGELYPDEFPRVPSEGREITHWMPLPAAPEASHDNS